MLFWCQFTDNIKAEYELFAFLDITNREYRNVSSGKKISVYANFSHPVSMLVNSAQSCGAVGNLIYSVGRGWRILCSQEFKAGPTVLFDPKQTNSTTLLLPNRSELIIQLGSPSLSAFLLLHNAENGSLGLRGTGECFPTELFISSWRITVLEWLSQMT